MDRRTFLATSAASTLAPTLPVEVMDFTAPTFSSMVSETIKGSEVICMEHAAASGVWELRTLSGEVVDSGEYDGGDLKLAVPNNFDLFEIWVTAEEVTSSL